MLFYSQLSVSMQRAHLQPEPRKDKNWAIVMQTRLRFQDHASLCSCLLDALINDDYNSKLFQTHY